jgi:hypothetical protein
MLFAASCAVTKFAATDVVVAVPVIQSPIPEDFNEWDITLKSPVVAMKQEVQSHFLPDQIYDLFPTGLDFPGWPMGHTLGLKNNLPGDSFNWGITGDFIYWNLTDKKDWMQTQQTDPKDFVYVIKNNKDLIALWFTGPQTVHMRKVQWPTLADRQKEVKIPLFDQEVKFKWAFESIKSGYEEDILKSVKGKVIESSMQNGFVYVTTIWADGEDYVLPSAYTRISAGGKAVYAD